MNPQDISVAELLSQAVVLRGGSESQLEDLIGRGPAVLVFLRHFGCIGCSANMADLAPRLNELERLGATVVLIGNGTPDELDGFFEKYALAGKPVTAVTDPALETYRSAGLERSAWRVWGPRGAFDFLRALGQGHWQSGFEGSVNQLGGTVVLSPEREVVFYHRARSLGDAASANDIVDAVLRCVARRAADD